MDEALLAELRGVTDRRGVTRYRALADAIADAIRSGRLAVDDRLPAERGLATAIGVSRNTVVAAYEELRDRGMVRTRPGSGTLVEPGASPVASPREAWLTGALAPGTMLDRLVVPTRAPVDLRAGGAHDAMDLPEDLLALSAREVAEHLRAPGYAPAGLPVLREHIARHLTEDGLATDPDQVLVTAGAQQATSLLVRALVGPGEAVAVEQLTTAGVVAALTIAQADMRGIPLTSHGADVGALVRLVERHRPVMVHLSTAVQQPTGSVMPVPAARRLARAAEGWRTVIVDDRSRSMLQFRGDPPPPLASFVPTGGAARVITVGSLSRVAWAGLRIGWLRADRPSTVERLVRLRSADDLGLAIPSQLVAVRVMERFEEIAAGRRRLLRERYHELEHLMARLLPDFEIEPPRGGWTVIARLPAGRAARFAAIARTAGVELLPASVAAVGDVDDAYLLLSLGARPEVLRDGVRRMSMAWYQYQRELRGAAAHARRRADVSGRTTIAPRPRGIDSYRPPT